MYAASEPTATVDSVEVRRDLDSARIILRKLAEEAGRGNIDMVELSRFIVALIRVYIQTDRFGQVFPRFYVSSRSTPCAEMLTRQSIFGYIAIWFVHEV